MSDKAQWETPDLERIGHAGDIRSGGDPGDTEQFGSDPSGPA
jgi:hypothetical protein